MPIVLLLLAGLGAAFYFSGGKKTNSKQLPMTNEEKLTREMQMMRLKPGVNDLAVYEELQRRYPSMSEAALKRIMENSRQPLPESATALTENEKKLAAEMRTFRESSKVVTDQDVWELLKVKYPSMSDMVVRRIMNASKPA